jgi:polysaccharide export outer membrane protein
MITSRLRFAKLLNISFYRSFVILFTVAIMMASCATSKDSYYFKTLQKDTTLTGFVNNSFESKIRKGDNLGITINSLSPEENAKFNSAGLIVTERGTLPGYLVGPDGTILLYRFGAVKVEGLTKKELAAKLQKELLPFLKEPTVAVTYLNHKITVLGEVVKPQVINLEDDQMTVLDAIALSGDMNEKGRRDDVMIIRETETEKKVKHINLEDHSIFTSSWYYVQPNDIVYILPDTKRTDTEEKRRRLQTTLSLVASGLSLLIIILDRIIK